jgi:hypothetical protein
VLESAARLQQLVPDTVLVGGAAAAIYADRRLSLDHDHVMSDLHARFEMVLDALESDDGWATNRLVYGKVILGNLDGIEAGVVSQVARQLADPRPMDAAVTQQLRSYRRLDQRWTDWKEVRRVLSDVATSIVEPESR